MGKNIQKVQDMLDGNYKNKIQVGYSSQDEKREIGDKWTDSEGYQWEQKDGFKVKSGGSSVAKGLGDNCSNEECGILIVKPWDKDTFKADGRCYHCQLNYELDLQFDAPLRWFAYRRLKDNDTLGLYHQSYWEEYIYNAAQQFGYTIPTNILEDLTKRWAFFDKSYKIPTIRKDLKEQPEFLKWVLKTDKDNHKKMVKENMKPFETLFFEVGAEILKNVEGFMAASPNKAVQGIRKRLTTSIANVKASGDKKKLNTLKLQLDKLNKIGGVDSIVPSEGIVFKYNGKTYKFTGAFAPVNQITGLVSF